MKFESLKSSTFAKLGVSEIKNYHLIKGGLIIPSRRQGGGCDSINTDTAGNGTSTLDGKPVDNTSC